MISIRHAWRTAWSELPETAHRELSQPDGDFWFPKTRTIRSLFPTVFGSDIPDSHALPAALRRARSVKTFTSLATLDPTFPEDQQFERIVAAVRMQSDRLTITAELMPLLRKEWTAAELGTGDKEERLLKLAWSHAGRPVSLDEVLTAAPRPVPSVAGLRRLLADTELVAQLADQRDRLVRDSREPDDLTATITRAVPVFLRYLDDPTLDTKHTVVDGNSAAQRFAIGSESATSWAATCAVDSAIWEWRTDQVGLADAAPPAPPPITIAEESITNQRPAVQTARLDSSIQRRLNGVLRGETAYRATLPTESNLVAQEVSRASAPLGILSEAGRTVLALGMTLTSLIGERTHADLTTVGTGAPDVRLAKRIRDTFQRWHEQRSRTAGEAGTPHMVAAATIDPSHYYMSTLWTRVHGHDVHGTADYDAVTAHDLLTGIARSTTQRIDTLRTRAPVDPDPHPSPEVDDDTLIMSDLVERVRAGVENPDDWTRFWATISATMHISDDLLDRWAAWCTAADVAVELRDVLDWLARHRSE